MWTVEAVKEVIRYFFQCLGIFIVVMMVIVALLNVFLKWE